MGKKYNQLTEEKRIQLYRLLGDGISQAQIALVFKVNRSTIGREIRRNKHPQAQEYLPDYAQKAASGRRFRSSSKIEGSKLLMQKIEDYLVMGWSPEVIAGRLKLESGKQIISHESIYKWIYGAGKSKNLHKYLVRRKRNRGRRPCKKVDKIKIPERISIHKRPKSSDKELGHWEADTVYFAGHKEVVLTLYERTSKITLGAKMKTRQSSATMDYMESILSKLPEESRRSVTFDNGLEFYNHQRLKKSLGLKTYFCDAYASWQKGGVENANGILRRYIPKGSKADEHSAQDFQQYLHRINGTPRKSLAYKTPYESFLQALEPNTKLMSLINTNVALQF